MRQLGCHATVRKKDDAGGFPAKFRVDVNTREASKGKLWAGSDKKGFSVRYKAIPDANGGNKDGYNEKIVKEGEKEKNKKGE